MKSHQYAERTAGDTRSAAPSFSCRAYDPDHLPPQPHPVATHVARVATHGGEIVSLVDRDWEDGQTGHEGVCRLCDVCVARGNRCCLLVRGDVPDDLAPLFSPRGLALLG